VVDATLARDVGGSVGSPIVDDEPLNRIEAFDSARKCSEGREQELFLVEARNLDDQSGPAAVTRV
jgi:hypothetical protein